MCLGYRAEPLARAGHLLTDGISALTVERCIWVSLSFGRTWCLTCIPLCFAAARRHLCGDGLQCTVFGGRDHQVCLSACLLDSHVRSQHGN